MRETLKVRFEGDAGGPAVRETLKVSSGSKVMLAGPPSPPPGLQAAGTNKTPQSALSHDAPMIGTCMIRDPTCATNHCTKYHGKASKRPSWLTRLLYSIRYNIFSSCCCGTSTHMLQQPHLFTNAMGKNNRLTKLRVLHTDGILGDMNEPSAVI